MKYGESVRETNKEDSEQLEMFEGNGEVLKIVPKAQNM